MIYLNKQHGFTLVETAVVLVIIGLVMGGIIKATEFIENGRADRFIKDMKGFQGAYYGFNIKRGRYPGDMNGNKHINYDAVGINDGIFFQDLFDAGLTDSYEPEVPVENAGYYFANFLSITESTGLLTGTIRGKSQICATEVKDKYARHLDSKLDDGLHNTGIVRSLTAYGLIDRHTVCYQL
ncbi:MAG: prepilin-type N-terminal cleavage/methylation domain-containing protein [Pseudomonadota bacterium]|nr:prepilin-type N-terminal cleavage/methylation domain-containing protein [Pseudomonadota bacterium]